MTKIIGLDLDKTLLNNKLELTNFTKSIIQKVKEKKWKIIIVSGKPFLMAINFYKQLKLNYYMVCSMGQVIYKKNKLIKINLLNNLTPLLTNVLIKDFIVININKQIYTTNLIYLQKLNIYGQITYNLFDNQITDLIIFLDNKKNLDLLKKKYIEYDFYFWPIWNKQTVIARVVNKNISKEFAIKKIMEKKNIKLLDYYFGDGLSDIPIFKLAKTSYAMKNASLMVKKMANKITKWDCNNDGVAKELNKILLEKVIN